MSDAPELKPCPFCGSEVTIATGVTASAIYCGSPSSCLGSGLLIGFGPNDECTAIDAWNRRAPAVLAELPEVKAMVAAAVMDAALILRKMWNDPDATGESIETAILALIPKEATNE
jgi:Lar family restriction alleviation protein